jgi:hypothetical protein
LYFFDSDTPLELAGAVTQTSLPVARSANLGGVEALETARERVGQYVALDGPEYFLAPVGSLSAAGAWVRELRIGLRFTGLRAVVNLNCASPPPATVGTAGPLFASLAPGDELRYSDFCDALLDHLLDGDPEGVRVDWHLGDRDFEPVARNRLIRLARRVLDGAPLAFVPDRARRSIALAEGLDRHHAAVLCAVGVSLPRLAEIVRPVDPSVYLTKLGSLARLALSAGQARRDFLRRHARPDVSRGFEIDRARLVVTPVGLAEAVHKVIGQPLTAIGPGLEFARQVWQTLHAVLGGGTAPGFAVSLDSLPPLALHNSLPTTDSGAAEGTVRQQLRAAAVLHAEVEAGTAVVRLPTDHRPTPEDVAHLLWYAWQQPGLTRVSVVREVPAPRQLTAGWDAQGPQ